MGAKKLLLRGIPTTLMMIVSSLGPPYNCCKIVKAVSSSEALYSCFGPKWNP